MLLKTPLLVAATAIGLTTVSLSAQAATVRLPLTYNYSFGASSSSAGSGYFDIDDSLLAPNTSIIFPGNLNDLLGFSLTFTGLATTPTTTIFTLANLDDWVFVTNGTGMITSANFNSSPNADGYRLGADGPLFSSVNGNGQNTAYDIAVGNPSPIQPVPEPSSFVALLGLGLGFLAAKGKKQA